MSKLKIKLLLIFTLIEVESAYSMLDTEKEMEKKEKNIIKIGSIAKEKPKERIFISGSKLREDINFDKESHSFFSGIPKKEILDEKGSVTYDSNLLIKEEGDKVVFNCAVNSEKSKPPINSKKEVEKTEVRKEKE